MPPQQPVFPFLQGKGTWRSPSDCSASYRGSPCIHRSRPGHAPWNTSSERHTYAHGLADLPENGRPAYRSPYTCPDMTQDAIGAVFAEGKERPGSISMASRDRPGRRPDVSAFRPRHGVPDVPPRHARNDPHHQPPADADPKTIRELSMPFPQYEFNVNFRIPLWISIGSPRPHIAPSPLPGLSADGPVAPGNRAAGPVLAG